LYQQKKQKTLKSLKDYQERGGKLPTKLKLHHLLSKHLNFLFSLFPGEPIDL